jgi:PIN domain nuclease of toxin-antitoxin system
VRLLLDTHALLWWLDDSPRLPRSAREGIRDPDNLVYLSAVTAWEITVKSTLGKLVIPSDWTDVVADSAFRKLDVSWAHAIEVGRLPEIHRDPFDRLLVAQARIEGLTLVTHDESIARYGTPILWSE